MYQGFTHFTVVDLGPAPGLPKTYVIRTLVSAVEDSTRDVRRRRESVGKITFSYPAGQRFDRQRARATSEFADSLAKAFDLPEPDPIMYYFTDDLA